MDCGLAEDNDWNKVWQHLLDRKCTCMVAGRSRNQADEVHVAVCRVSLYLLNEPDVRIGDSMYLLDALQI